MAKSATGVHGPKMAAQDSSTDATTSLPDQPPLEPCHLLALPAEIRNMIYRYSVVFRRPLVLYPEAASVDIVLSRTKPYPPDTLLSAVRPSEPSLTKTSRQIRAEALPVFYGENVFTDSCYFPDCRKFLLGLTPAKQRMLQEIVVAPYYARLSAFDSPTCVSNEDKLEAMLRWVHKNGIEIGEGVIHIAGMD